MEINLNKKRDKNIATPLSWEEMDANWDAIEKAFQDVESDGADLNSIKARVANVSESNIATASVTVEKDNTLAFSFGLQRGQTGERGPQGPQGLQGPKGDQGDIALQSVTVFAFKSSSTKPDTPTGGSWNGQTITYPEGWSGDQDSLEGIIWSSNASFLEDGTIIRNWSEPIRITGADGKPGVDGKSIEFIYTRTETNYTTPTTPDSVQENDNIPEGWTDSPIGVTQELQVEWVCTRTKSNGVWSNYSTAAIWSKWGERGQDGDGVEYIYKRTNSAIPPSKPSIEGAEENEDGELIPTGWTDEPTGVDATYQWEWVSVRRYKKEQWGDFSNPALWAKYGENGDSGYSVRIMYTKTDNSSITPSVVKDNINPGSVWGIGIPEYSGTEALWGIQGTVTYDNKLVGEWEGPYLMSGVPGQDGTKPNYTIFIFKNSSSQPEAPSSNSQTPGDGWIDSPTGTGDWWICVGEVNGVTDLVSSWSTPIKVNGKDGADGADGQDGQDGQNGQDGVDGDYTEFRFKQYNADTITVTLTEEEKHNRNIEDWSVNPSVVTSGNAMWMIVGIIHAGDILDTSGWSNPIRVSGERGPQGNTGPAGPQGVSGTPAINYENLYSYSQPFMWNEKDGQSNAERTWYNLCTYSYVLWSKYKNDIDLPLRTMYDLEEADFSVLSFNSMDVTIKTEAWAFLHMLRQQLDGLKDSFIGVSTIDENLFNQYMGYLQYFITYHMYIGWSYSLSSLSFSHIKPSIDKQLESENLTTLYNTKLSDIPTFDEGALEQFSQYGITAESTMEELAVVLLTHFEILSSEDISFPYIQCTQARVRQDEESLKMTFVDGESWCTPFVLTGTNGLKGEDGKDGQNGENGVGVTGITDYYKLTSTNSAPTITTTDSKIPLTPTEMLPYLWVREYVSYSNSTGNWTGPARLLASWQENSIRVTDTVTTYAYSTSSSAMPPTFSTNMPDLTEDGYLWTKITTTYSDGSNTSSYTVTPVKGTTQRVVTSITELYQIVSGTDYENPPTGGTWITVEEMEIPSSGDFVIWNKERINYSDGSQEDSDEAHYVTDSRYTFMTDAGTFSITSIKNYYAVVKKGETESNVLRLIGKSPNSEEVLQRLENISTSLFDDVWVPEEESNLFMTLFTINNYVFLLGYEEIIHMTPFGLSTTYNTVHLVKQATPTVKVCKQLYLIGERKNTSSSTNFSGTDLYYYAYIMSNPNAESKDYNDFVNLTFQEAQTLYNNLAELTGQQTQPITEEIYQQMKTLFSSWNGQYDSWSSDMVFQSTDGTFTANDRQLWMITANLTYSNLYGTYYFDGTTRWSEPVLLNRVGPKGEAGTGDSISSIKVEFGLSSSRTSYSDVTSWSTTVPETTSSKRYIWVRTTYSGTSGVIDTTYSLYTAGREIVSITNYYLGSTSSSGITNTMSGWSTTVVTPTASLPYVWNYELITYNDGTTQKSAAHIIAMAGKDGQDGQRGQLVYPAGTYSNTTRYTTDVNKAPYVLDPSDGNYYVLNAQMTWLGTQQNNRTPAQDYAANKGKYWMKFDGFDAIYAKIGIINNGLIGSAVFNGDYMFSQYGYNALGNLTTSYQNFSTGVFTTSYTSGYSFFPAYAVNLKTGGIYTFGPQQISTYRSQVPIIYKKIMPGYEITGALYSSSSTYNSCTYPVEKVIKNGTYEVHTIANGKKYYTYNIESSSIDVYGVALGGGNSELLVNAGNSTLEVFPWSPFVVWGGTYETPSLTVLSFRGEMFKIISNGTKYNAVSDWLTHLGANV